MPFSSKTCDYNRLKINLQLCKNRLDLIYKKKTELNVRARREVAELLRIGKIDRARLHTEHIIRQDYEAEAIEMLGTLMLLLYQNFGVFQHTKEVDRGLEKTIATIIWCTPRLGPQVSELATIKTLLEAKYSKEYVQACLADSLKIVDPVVMQKLMISSCPPNLVEQYLVEIAKTYDVPYEPVTSVGGSLGDADSREIENRLINFEPDAPGGLPELPSGAWNQPEQTWPFIPNVGPGAPYPENPQFPISGTQVIPTAPVPPNAFDPISPPTNIQNVAPPSYDSTIFPVKPDGLPPPLPNMPPVAPGQNGPPSYVPPGPGNSSTEGSDHNDDDLDDLQRRFQELTKK